MVIGIRARPSIPYGARQERLRGRYAARKAAYQQKREGNLGGRWITRPPHAPPATVAPALEEPIPLIDVIDEGDRLRVVMQLRNALDLAGLPCETSLRHGVLEMVFLKKGEKNPFEDDIKRRVSSVWDEIIKSVKEKVILAMMAREEVSEG